MNRNNIQFIKNFANAPAIARTVVLQYAMGTLCAMLVAVALPPLADAAAQHSSTGRTVVAVHSLPRRASLHRLISVTAALVALGAGAFLQVAKMHQNHQQNNKQHTRLLLQVSRRSKPV